MYCNRNAHSEYSYLTAKSPGFDPHMVQSRYFLCEVCMSFLCLSRFSFECYSFLLRFKDMPTGCLEMLKSDANCSANSKPRKVFKMGETLNVKEQDD